MSSVRFVVCAGGLLCLAVVAVTGRWPLAAAQEPADASQPRLSATPPPDTPADLQRSARPVPAAEHGVGRLTADLQFRDLSGQTHQLSDFRSSRALVLAVTSTSCPLSRRYLPRLAELARTYAARDCRFILINPVPTDRPADMQAAAAALGDHALYVSDPDERLIQQLGALTTTDVFVLDAARTVVYHGAVDDQYGIGYSLPEPRHRYLADALDALQNGTSPRIAATSAPGCALDPQPAASTHSTVTWHNRISRILQQNCLDCHRSGGVGPFGLETYDEALAHAAMIRQVVQQQLMPPWFAAPQPGQAHSPWANDRSLSAQDRDDLLAWLSSDRPLGDPADAPLPRNFPADEWTIGTPDLIVQLPQPISVPAEGTMPYQYVHVTTTLTEDKWIQGYEIRPTDRSVVHHVLVNVDETEDGQPRNQSEGSGAGYWALYVPGNSSQVYPPGFARRLPAGATVSFQIHYTPNGTATQDQLQLGVRYASSAPQHVVQTIFVADTELDIPPHAAAHIESITRPVPTDIHVLGYMPHLHVRGKSFEYTLTTADGRTESLLNIPRYDFNWQLRYEYREPRVLPKGSRITVSAVFDNSAQNPANPNPAQRVTWGEQTFDEMLIGYVETFVPLSAARSPRRNRSAGDLFTQLDLDQDELLTLEEVRPASARAPRLRNNPQLLEQLFRQVDQDNNQGLNHAEFAKLRELAVQSQ